MIHDKEGTRRGAMTVHLADFDGRVLLGAVGGALIAATPVQVRLFFLLFFLGRV